MSTLKLNGKSLASQTSSAEPVIASTVTGGAGLSGMTSLGTVTTGTLGSGVTFPAGHVLQVKGTNANASWGAIGHSSEFHLSDMDVSITTVGLNSDFWILGRFNSFNANGGAFGVGLGFKHYIGSTETTIISPHLHEMYAGGTTGHYFIAHQQNFLTSLNTAIGTVIVFRAYGRFNNANGNHSIDQTDNQGQQLTVMEIQS